MPLTELKFVVSLEKLKGLCNSIVAIAKTVTVRVDPEGLAITEMDISHVSLIDVRIGELWFEEFEGVETTFTLNLENFAKLLTGGKNDRVTVTKKEGADKVNLLLVNSAGTRTTQRMNLLNDADDEMPVPPFNAEEYGLVVDCDVKQLEGQMKKFVTIDAHDIVFRRDDDGRVVLSSDTSELASINVELFGETGSRPEGDELAPMVIRHEVDTVISETQSMRFIRIIYEGLGGVGKRVTFHVAPEMPLVFETMLGEGEGDGFIRQYLSAKLEED